MKTKNFLVAGFVGGVVNWLLGWLFYGFLLKDTFPQPEESSKTMIFILLGCLTLGLFLSYIYIRWAEITTAVTGAKAGAVLGLFLAIFYNCFNMAMQPEMTMQMFAIDVVVTVVMTAVTGAVIGLINGKLG